MANFPVQVSHIKLHWILFRCHRSKSLLRLIIAPLITSVGMLLKVTRNSSKPHLFATTCFALRNLPFSLPRTARESGLCNLIILRSKMFYLWDQILIRLFRVMIVHCMRYAKSIHVGVSVAQWYGGPELSNC